ncbi:MAG: ATP-binding protein [Candidatus Margulisbacteria bacterium]|nr:ATP-binding protein [Candidatus Margulisiibacteriota bacterium]
MKDEIRKVIENWEEWVTYQTIIPRPDYYRNVNANFALVYLGARRSGKSFIAYSNVCQLPQGENHLYINFEDPFFVLNHDVSILDKCLEVFVEMKSVEPTYLIFDEIQNIDHWERWVRKAIDFKKYKIVLTGSSAKLLSSELSTTLTGRAIEKKVWPLSFLEYVTFSKKKMKTENEKVAALHHYLKWGGFPEAILEKSKTVKKEILSQYTKDILYKDIVTRYSLRHVPALIQISQFYLRNISCLISFTKVKNAFSLNFETVQEYSKYLEDTFLIFFMKRYHPNLKIQNRDPQKVYTIDTGLRNCHVLSFSEDLGKLAENAVFIELNRRGYTPYYFKETYEVDFIILDDIKPIQAIQVCYDNMENSETYAREVRALEECMNTLHLDHGLILTKNRLEKLTIGSKSIQLLPLHRWLGES